MRSQTIESQYVDDIAIDSHWEESWKAHLKTELLLFEVKCGSTKVLYNGGGWQSRHDIMISAVREAVRLRPIKGTKRFYLFTGDNFPASSLGTAWKLLTTVGSRKETDIVIPDAYSFSWPEIGVSNFETYNAEMMQRSDYYSNSGQVLQKTYWRGALVGNPARTQFVDYVKESEGFDVIDIAKGSFREMKESGEFSVLVDLPGQGYSARLKHLLLSKRPVIVYPRTQWDWVTLRLEPNVHFPVSLASIDYLVSMCNAFNENSQAASFYSNEAFQATIDLMSHDRLYKAISDAIADCD